tara:strand:+ start:290 stop:607 length:318 start_codon:yes stop_codon:yes gene_type:complete
MYGGDLSEEEFHKHSKSTDRPPVLSMPHTENFIHKVIIMDDKPLYTQQGSKIDQTPRRLAEINSVTNIQKTDALRLKRPIPIKLGKNNIENALGLVRKSTCLSEA